MMRLVTVVIAMLLAASANAQDAPKTFTLNVTAQDLNVLQAGLDELPRKISEPIVQKFQKQLIPQMQPVEAKATDEKK